MRILPTDPSPRPHATGVRRALLATGLVAGLAVPSVALHPAGAEPPGGPTTVAAQPSVDRTLPGLHRITLLTGDVVALQVTADGRQAAWIADPVNPSADPQIYEADGEVHVVPAEAAPYVASGALDDKLFNVTLLARSGYDDRSVDELPLLVESAQTRTSSVPDAPSGTDEVRELDSVAMVSVTADKANMRTAWEGIRGSKAAPLTSTSARLADGVTVWLNGKVEATLDDSVAQIGAPAAWEAGYDGDGTTVAVLDTGYDQNHPDLADRVVDAANFSEAADSPVDGNGHGTHVAATVGGSGAASDGDRKGVAPGTDLLIGKVLDDNGEGYTDEIIAGMEWAVDQDADVVNMSLGTLWASDGTDPLSEAVNDLTRSSDSLFVVAAGNTGPGASTVGSPGAADLALTVGAVTKDDQPAAFSSRGPRVGDGAIKPEITAPGVDIVAARAAGTSLGNLLDEHYTSLNGTSMATPHVAGAAAILAQRHPDWDAAALKARLASTAKTMANQPVTFQGGGRLDVAAAVQGQVTVDHGSVYLGQLADTSGPVTRQLTYHNTSDRRIWLRLSTDVTGTGSDSRQRPALRLSRSIVSIPAHGTTSVKATLTPRWTDPGGYAGQIVARPLGGRPTGPVHTTVAFTVDGPTRTVTVRAVDRAGQPATGPVDLWSAETGEVDRNFLSDGMTTFEVPDGLYSLIASIGGSAAEVQTIGGDPELRVRRDTTVRLDARRGRPVDIGTPKDADVEDFHVYWHRRVGDRTVWVKAAQGIFGEKVFLLPSDRARTGSFTLASEWMLGQPLLTARVAGPDGFRLPTPQLASAGYGGFCQCPVQAFEGEGTLPLVNAGSGSGEEFDAVAADGSVALASRSSAGLSTQAEAAERAGAEALLVYNDSEGRWTGGAINAPLPVYRLDLETGQALLDALADGEVSLELTGVRDAAYQYDLVFTEKGRIPAGGSYTARPNRLATIKSDYRQNSERMTRNEGWIPYVDGAGVMNLMGMHRNGPLVRTEYVTATEGITWQRFAQPHMFLGTYWTTTNPERYEPRQTYDQTWWGPLVHAAIPPPAEGASAAPLATGYQPVARYRDAIRINFPHYVFDGSLTSTIYETFGDRSGLTLTRDGEVVGTSTWPRAQYTVPADDATYELSLDTVNGDGNWSDTSVASETTWRFRSERTDEKRTVLPLVQAEYGLDADAYNAMPADETYPLTITPGYQPQATGPGGFTADVEVSFDDGDSWQAVAVERNDGRFQAQIPSSAGPGYASVRVVVADADGNRLTQRIDRAWKIASP